MKVIVTNNSAEMSQVAARIVARQVLAKKSSVLGLPTGETPKGMYNKLVELYRNELIDFSHVTTFNIDELLGPEYPATYASYMEKRFWSRVNLSRDRAFIMSSRPTDEKAECEQYESSIIKAGGLDLVILGIGTNGHVGFNEPGAAWGLTTHAADLSSETHEREARSFAKGWSVPHRAITMGIKTIMNARQILLLATGKEKAKIVAPALLGPLTPQVPASVLQLHPKLTVVLDKAAGEKIP